MRGMDVDSEAEELPIPYGLTLIELHGMRIGIADHFRPLLFKLIMHLFNSVAEIIGVPVSIAVSEDGDRLAIERSCGEVSVEEVVPLGACTAVVGRRVESGGADDECVEVCKGCGCDICDVGKLGLIGTEFFVDDLRIAFRARRHSRIDYTNLHRPTRRRIRRKPRATRAQRPTRGDRRASGGARKGRRMRERTCSG